ncbi:ABC transporter ATP-binding protein [Eubacteriales bacterium KG127]
MEHNLRLIKTASPYFKKYKNILFVDLICAALTTTSEMVLPLILRYMTNLGLADRTSLTMEIVVRLALIFVVVKSIELVAVYYMASIGHIMGAKIETDMRFDVYHHLQTLSDNFYNNTKVGQIMSRMTNDLFDITEFAHHCPEEYFIGFIKIVIAFIILININVPMTILIFLMIPLMFVASSNFKNKMRDAQKEQRVHVGDLNSSIEDSLLGIKVVKSFANEEVESKKFEIENKKFLSIKSVFYKSMAGFNTVNRTIDGAMYFVVVVFGGIQIIRGTLDPGGMIAYIMYVTTLLATVKRIVEFTEQFQKGMTGIERFKEIMSIEPEIYDKKGAVDLTDVQGEIEFKHVTFKYIESQENVLDDFNLKIRKGQNIALVGPSGGGKTTVCALISRFYDVVSGEIRVDGKNIKDLTLKSLRNNIGIVQQDVYLFSGTVEDNILYGKPDATKEEVVKAAKMAGAYEFIMDLENGFNTYVGERGVKLSGGQKQRISIARVFLKNPPILILDEATSALDNNSEAIVQQSLEKLSKGRTTVTIAHRLTTIQNSDHIIVLGPDGIVEEGTHDDLMNKRAYYYRLYTKSGDLMIDEE